MIDLNDFSRLSHEDKLALVKETAHRYKKDYGISYVKMGQEAGFSRNVMDNLLRKDTKQSRMTNENLYKLVAYFNKLGF